MPDGSINPWVIAVTVTLATFMEVLDTSIANVALPHISGNLSAGADESTWVLTSYLVSNAIVLPLSGWLSGLIGRKRFYMSCVALFTVSSFLCGLAPSLGILVFFRILQGAGGGGLQPSEQAILNDTFPLEKRGMAFAVYGVAVVVAPTIGPWLGGWITDSFSWRWVFFINIPIGIISLILTSRMVSDPPEFKREVEMARKAGKLSIDYIGIALVAIGFACLEVVLDRGEREDWFESHFIVIFFAIAIVALVVAVIWELRYPDPVVELALLKERNFAISNAFYFMFGFTLFGSTVLIPQMLQSLYGYRAIDAGLVLGPGAFVITLLAPVGAQLVQNGIVKPRNLLFCAVIVVGLSFLHYSRFTLDTDYNHYAWARALQGFGYAFFFVPVSMIAYSQLKPGQNNKASSITNFFRNWGGSFGIAFIGTLSERRLNFHQARVGDNLPSTAAGLQQQVSHAAAFLQSRGFSPSDAFSAAYARFYGQLQSQAHLLAFMDCFRVIGIVTLIAAPLVLLTRSFNLGGKAPAGH